MKNRNPENIQGCDLSHFESNVDVATTPGSIVYLKASEGDHSKDDTFESLYEKVKSAGKKAGAYHFLHLGGNYTVEKQVDNAVESVQGKQLDCLYGIDIENGGYHDGTPQEVTAQILQFADKFTAKTGLQCCVYASTSFIKEHFTANIKRLPLWVAHYGVDVPGDNGIWDSWAGFQYTDKPYDLDEFTNEILISSPVTSQKQVQSMSSSGLNRTGRNDVYAVPSLPCDWNATAGTDFDVRTSDGTAIPGRQIFNGDRMIILSVNFDAQLAEVLYPTPHCWVHGWIRNLQNDIHDRWHFKWHNGSTKEITYGSSAGDNQIGSIEPEEYATPLFAANGRIALLYNTSKGEETKFGYVNYHGGFNF